MTPPVEDEFMYSWEGLECRADLVACYAR
jgi:hypothetical protein